MSSDDIKEKNNDKRISLFLYWQQRKHHYESLFNTMNTSSFYTICLIVQHLSCKCQCKVFEYKEREKAGSTTLPECNFFVEVS